jgi:hypothetical protein
MANVAYIGFVPACTFINSLTMYPRYTLYQGEIKSIYLLRSLRWICSLFVSVLFIPILCIHGRLLCWLLPLPLISKDVLLEPLACDYSYSPAVLMNYSDVECWGSKNIAISIVASGLLVVFSLFSLIVGLTYYEYDPNVVKTYPPCPILLF